MSTFSGGARTVCPFYMRESAHTIVCEGAVQKSELHMRFARAADKTAWQDHICTHYSFRRCPLACAAEAKYERTPL